MAGTWSASLEWLVACSRRAFPRSLRARCATASSRGSGSTLHRGRARGRRRARRASARCCSASRWAAPSRSSRPTSRRSSAWSGSRRGSPTGSTLEPLAGKRLDVLHGSLDRWLPGVPGRLGGALAARLRARPGARRRGAVHADPRRRARSALRAPGGRLVPLPRARRRGRGSSSRLSSASRLKPAPRRAAPRVGHLHVPDEPEPLEPADHPPRDVDLAAVRARAAPRRGRRGGCCASPRRRRAARRASCCAPRRASGSPGGRTCGRSSSR